MTTELCLSPCDISLSDDWGDLARYDEIIMSKPEEFILSELESEPEPEIPDWLDDDEKDWYGGEIYRAWQCPNLKLRKDIWSNFPVTVVSLGKDEFTGAERHSIQWHKTNLLEYRRNSDFDEDIDLWRIRLLIALKASDKWTVHDKETLGLDGLDWGDVNDAFYVEREICIIHMTFEPTEDKPATSAPEPAQKIPTLRRLNDIKEHFHVAWTKQDDNIYSICIHKKNAQAAGVDIAQHQFDLLEALNYSRAWKVLRGEKGEVCRIKLTKKE